MSDFKAQKIFDEIRAYMRVQGGPLSSWYIGITQSIEQRLFNDHRVLKDKGWWMHRQAMSSHDARNVEKAFLDLGCDGGTGGGDNDAVFVYAFLKTAATVR